MKLSTRSRYGTRIILELARHFGKEPVQVSEIAKIQKIPDLCKLLLIYILEVKV